MPAIPGMLHPMHLRESAVCGARLQNSRLNYEVWYKICPEGGKGWENWNAWNVSTSSIGSGSIHGKVNMPAILEMPHPMNLRESAVCGARLQNSRLNYEVWYKICPEVGGQGLGEMECLVCIHVIYWVGINPWKGKHAGYSRNAAFNAPEGLFVCLAMNYDGRVLL
ncbi:hypothetical protein CDAR_83041 [Caerostris darwini]|uniref:Uncharacterized protein n=1 Tax=Caerostris darwini TaxID=1538125 RepID=A0AAV4NSV9_9ARAC|nr:hypothetical protein CDAR_83041 [Caerostris darwini]